MLCWGNHFFFLFFIKSQFFASSRKFIAYICINIIYSIFHRIFKKTCRIIKDFCPKQSQKNYGRTGMSEVTRLWSNQWLSVLLRDTLVDVSQWESNLDLQHQRHVSYPLRHHHRKLCVEPPQDRKTTLRRDPQPGKMIVLLLHVLMRN